MQSLVTGDDEPDGDGLALTRLATRLQNRIPDLCVLKTFYDGRETVPLQSVPKAATTTASAVYRRFVGYLPVESGSYDCGCGNHVAASYRFSSCRRQDDAEHGCG